MNNEETTSMIPIRHTQTNALDRISDPVTAVEKMGDWFARSGMFGCEKPEQGMILALAAICERKSPLEIADTYHLVGGQLTMKSRAQLAKYRQRGGKVKWIKSNDNVCDADWTFEGETTRVGFTRKEAESMGLIRKGSGWEKAPAEMLRARCTTRAITMLCPEILVGGGIEDEAPAPAPAQNPIPRSAENTTAALPEDPKPKKRAKKVEKDPEPAPETPEPAKSDNTPSVDENAADVKADQMEKAATAIEEGVERLISVEEIKAIMDLCADCEVEADAWLLGKEWIKKSGELKTMTAANAKRILNSPEKFVRAVKKAAGRK